MTVERLTVSSVSMFSGCSCCWACRYCALLEFLASVTRLLNSWCFAVNNLYSLQVCQWWLIPEDEDLWEHFGQHRTHVMVCMAPELWCGLMLVALTHQTQLIRLWENCLCHRFCEPRSQINKLLTTAKIVNPLAIKRTSTETHQRSLIKKEGSCQPLATVTQCPRCPTPSPHGTPEFPCWYLVRMRDTQDYRSVPWSPRSSGQSWQACYHEHALPRRDWRHEFQWVCWIDGRTDWRQTKGVSYNWRICDIHVTDAPTSAASVVTQQCNFLTNSYQGFKKGQV